MNLRHYLQFIESFRKIDFFSGSNQSQNQTLNQFDNITYTMFMFFFHTDAFFWHSMRVLNQHCLLIIKKMFSSRAEFSAGFMTCLLIEMRFIVLSI